MPRRVRVPIEGLVEGELTLGADASHYLVRVHRLRTGDAFLGFDPESRLEADGELLVPNERAARGRFGRVREAQQVSPLWVTLVQAFGKGDKVDRIIRDATALGARAVIIVETERSIARGSADNPATHGETRRARWHKIAVESARQCGRGDLPDVSGPAPFAKVIHESRAQLACKWCFQPEAERSFASALTSFRPERHAMLLIGPEGGFTTQELDLALEAGFLNVSLGPFTLRTETAAAVALGVLFAQASSSIPRDA